MEQNQNPYIKLWEVARRYFSLNVENLKLTATEKITMVLSAMVLLMAGVLLGVTLLFFIALGVVQFLAPYVGMGWAFMIMAAGVAALGAVIFLMRNQLIFNPVSRFISRVLLK